MADLSYKLILNNPGYYQFTMPDGFTSNVDVHLWGASGGSGSDAAGSGGGYAQGITQISSGDTVQIVVGKRGGDASGASPGSAGTGAIIGFNGGAGAAQGDPEDNDAGASGGGGGASALLINGNVSVVGAGGGGGGGYGEDGAGGATNGLPGGVYIGRTTDVYPVTLSYAWGGFMNSYAVWGGGQDYTVTLNFPTTGTYTFNYSVDNYGSLYLDGSAIISLSGTVTSHFNTTTTHTATVSSGNHTVRVTGVNTGGPAGVAAQILKPDSNELWNTRALIISDGLTSTTNGQDGRRGGSGGAGGGGGGFRGGDTGIAYGDDQQGGQGGNGGQNYGNITIAGSGITAGGRTTVYAAAKPPYGNAGYDGYAVLVFTRKMRMYYKDAGNWTNIEKVWYKASNPGTIANVETKVFNTISTTAERWTVPRGVTKLTVRYPTATGIATALFPVTAGETLSVKLGDFGVVSTIAGLSGILTVPAYDKKVFTYSGNVDHIIAQDVQVATDSLTSYTGSGGNATLEAGSAAAGITYTVTYEGWHGDLGASISITPALKSTIFQPLQVYVKTGSGRQYPGAHTYQQQPTLANGYVMNDYQGDYYGGEGGYSWETWMYQQGYVSVSYDRYYNVGEWVEINQIYYKDGSWKPLFASDNITPTKLS